MSHGGVAKRKLWMLQNQSGKRLTMSLLVLTMSGLDYLKFRHLSPLSYKQGGKELSSTSSLYSQFFFSAKSLLQVSGLPKNTTLVSQGASVK